MCWIMERKNHFVKKTGAVQTMYESLWQITEHFVVDMDVAGPGFDGFCIFPPCRLRNITAGCYQIRVAFRVGHVLDVTNSTPVHTVCVALKNIYEPEKLPL